MSNERLNDSGLGGVASTNPALTTTQPWLEGHVMAEHESTAARPFFKSLPEYDNLNTAYFLAKVAENIEVDASGCWVWMGSKASKGYGKISRGYRSERLHRVIYELCVASVPPSLFVLHECDNPPCCNPSHLFLGTKGDNNRDCRDKGRRFQPDVSGHLNGRAELTAEQVQDIRNRGCGGPRGIIKTLASEYMVSVSTISRIVNDRAWKK